MEPIILTPKQQKFCDEYLIDLNATKAALRAGYSGSTALNGKLMTIPKIRYYLQQRTEAASRKAQVSHEMVLSELSKIAFGNMRNYYRSDGTMKGVHELTDDEAAALWCMKVTDGKDGQTSFIRMNNKLSALEKIAKHILFYNMEYEPPEKVYVYLDPERMDDDDTFDDALFDASETDDDEEYYDEDDEQYYPWDTECKVAVAQARMACKVRRRDSLESGVGSSELGEDVAVAVAVADGDNFESGEFEESAEVEDLESAEDEQDVISAPVLVSPELTGRLMNTQIRMERKQQAENWR